MIYTQDHGPAHVHAVRGTDLVVFLINCSKGSVGVRGNTRVRSSMVRELQTFVSDNLTLICESWRLLHGE